MSGQDFRMLDLNPWRIGLAVSLFSCVTLNISTSAAMDPSSEIAPSAKSPRTSQVESGPGWILTKPALPEEHYDTPLRLPWGKATQHSIVFTDEARQVYLTFASYSFAKPPGRINAKLLRDVPKVLLKHRKCAILSTSRNAPPMVAGSTWPTIVFTGNCVGGDQFRWVVLIAKGEVFSFQVAALISMSSADLNRTLSEFMAGFRQPREEW